MAKVDLQTARTHHADPVQAAEELLGKLGGATPKLVTLFASRERDQRALNRAVLERLPKGTRLIGATTGGEIDNQGMHQGSVVLAAMSGDFEVGIGLGKNLTQDAIGAGSRAMAAASAELGTKTADLDTRRTVGLVIDDGFRYKKEELLLGVLEKNAALTLVGGGANAQAPDPVNLTTELHVDGEVATDAALVALFRTSAPWGALRSHWYLPSGETVTITKVDETCTRALEIDGQPAARRYAEILGVRIDELEFGLPNGFAQRPTALKVGREYFIRAPWKPLDDGSIVFANLLEEGCELEVMKLGDPVALTRDFFEKELPHRVKNPRASLLFHCTARAWYSATLGRAQELSGTFAAAPPSAGFNVFFEIYSGFHINTTLTVLAFGENEA